MVDHNLIGKNLKSCILSYDSSDCVDNLFDNAAPSCVQEYVDYDE